MATPSRKATRIGAGIAVLAALVAGGGCAAHAEYVYDEPIVYRPAPVYVAPPPVRVYAAPPPVVVYHDHPHHYYAPRREVRVYRAPAHVHRAPPAYYHGHTHNTWRHYDRDDHHGGDRRHRR